MHGFIQGLLANGWLYESNGRYYLGPAVHGLALASGHIRAGVVTQADLEALHKAAGTAVFLGVEAGEHLIYIAEMGSDAMSDFEAPSNIRRSMLATAGGKALLAAKSPNEREAYLRRRSAGDASLVADFIEEFDAIALSRVAVNVRRRGTRFAMATTVRDRRGATVASVTLVGATIDVKPRAKRLAKLLLAHVDAWSRRDVAPREVL